jgi:hypothetical protein
MRTLTVLSMVLLASAVSFGQTERGGYAGYCPYGCGPYIPLLTTPSVSLETVSPNPVGATNATGGLVAGATNSTLSEVSGNTDAVHTEAVWYSGGGSPLTAPAVNSPIGSMKMMRPGHTEAMHREEHEAGHPAWIYYSAGEHHIGGGASVALAATGHPAKHSYTNEDVERQNEQNGNVHYDSKNEKIQ